MANNYTRSSVALTVNEEQERFLKDAGELADCIDDGSEPVVPEWAGELARSVSDYGWGWQMTTYPVSPGTIYVYSEETANVEGMALLLTEYLCRFDPKGCIMVTWALTCSSPRPDEFGGGGMLVYAKETIWLDVQDELRKILHSDQEEG